MSARGWIQRKTYKNLEDYLNSYGKFIVRQARKTIAKKTKGSSGDLKNSLKYKLNFKKQDFSVEFNSNKYGEFVEKGVEGVGGLVSKGGSETPTTVAGYRTYITIDGKRRRSPYKFKTKKPPVNSIIPWITKKGISVKPGQTIKDLAFAISYGIFRRGTPGISFYTQPISATKRLFNKKLKENFARDIEVGLMTHAFGSKI
tara:strand:- start:5545 stop:6147 length:603 start_codon:yes stop_codon:yes gene_type:complete